MPQEFDDAPFEIDHIIARKHDGPTVASNLTLSCFFQKTPTDYTRSSPLSLLGAAAPNQHTRAGAAGRLGLPAPGTGAPRRILRQHRRTHSVPPRTHHGRARGGCPSIGGKHFPKPTGFQRC
jgi:HNH endonuclease